jgi:8-oxo-dGTP pyrophosphatase MutT (NUDIX family)
LSLEDDVAEVNNDFVYKKFAEKQNTADNVIFKELPNGTVELLVIKRKRGPHRSLFALPGGIVDYEMSNEQIIKGVIDPTGFQTRNMDYHEYVGDVPIEPGTLKSYNSDEIFAEEAIREAFEEVNLNKKFIKNSFILPIKLDRYDWDARAAQGVNVGGVGIIVDNEWIPKAKDDAIAYEWIKLDDVISGKKELAFGHVEFVRDALRTSIKNNLFGRSNNIKIIKGNSVYTYDDIEKLDERILETSKRNSEIIAKANVVRKQNNQPLIPTENIDSIVNRKNRAFIDSIRGLRSYTSNSQNPVKFTAQMQMKPDFIFSELFNDITDQALFALKLDDSDIVGFKELVEVLDDDNNLYRETGESLASDNLELTPSGKRKVKTEIKYFYVLQILVQQLV